MAPVAFGRRQPWCSAHVFMVRAVARIVEQMFDACPGRFGAMRLRVQAGEGTIVV